MNGCPHAAVVAVTAPAGFGKTTAVAGWLAGCGGAVAWLTLDDTDDSAIRLAGSLIAAIRTAVPGWGSGLGALFEVDIRPPLSGLEWGAVIAAEWGASAAAVTLVVDDVHLLTEPHTLDLLRRLAASTASTASRLVLLSRHDLAIDRPVLEAGGRLVEVVADDLRFDRDEAERLALRVAPQALGTERLDQALTATAGWPAALRLLLAAGDVLPDADVVASIDWLVAGAIAQVPWEFAERLLYGAVASEFCDGLLDAALPPDTTLPAMRLEDAGPELANLLVAQYEGGEWRRLHPLVREALERRLIERDGPAVVIAAHRRVARWFAGVGLIEPAVQHALQGDEPALAAEIVEEAGFTALNQERWDHLVRYLEVLPTSIVSQRAGLQVLSCWRQYHRVFHEDVVAPELAAARAAVRLLDGVPSARDAVARYEAHLDVLETYTMSPVPTTAELTCRADSILARLGPEDDNVAGIMLGTVGIATGLAEGAEAGAAYLTRALQMRARNRDRVGLRVNALSALLVIDERCGGRGLDRRPILEEIHRLGEANDLPGTSTSAAIGSGWLALARLDLDDARVWFNATMSFEGSQATNVWLWGRGGMALAAVLAGQGADADRHAAEMVRTIDATYLPRLAANSRSFQARIWLLQHRLDLVRDWLDGEEDEGRSFLLRESSALTRVRAMMALDPGGADLAVGERLARLRDATAGAGAGDGDGIMPDAPPWLLDAITICESVLLHRQHRLDDAVALFLPVAQGAAGRQDLLALVEFGGMVRPLVEAAMACGLDVDFGGRVSVAIDRLSALWPDPRDLTEREQAVLRLMAEPLSFDEIAARLFLAPATARVYATRIYRRLGVAQRRVAVERGRALGLIERS